MSSEKGEQKRTLPTKSSMEILSELFSTFHAEPPLIIKKEKSEEPSKKHKKSKKKHKHKDKKHKKKEKKKRKDSSSSSSEESELDLAKLLIKREKDTSEKKIKVENAELTIKQSKALKKQRDLEHEQKDRTKAELNDTVKRNKMLIKNLNLNSIFETTIKEIENKVKGEVDEGEISESSSSDEELKRDKIQKSVLMKRSRSSSSTDTNEKKLKTDRIKIVNRDRKREESHSKEKRKHRDYNEKNLYKGSYHSRKREKIKDRQRDHRSRSRERYKDIYNSELGEYRRSSRSKDFFYKDDGFYKSREKEDKDAKSVVRDRYRNHSERDRKHRSLSKEREGTSKFDKKKLLEIARRNAITMMKSGSLPGALTLGPQAQEKVIAAIKSGGKTVEELTDFCKTLSKKEELGELSSLSEKDDSESETDKPFHHPFQIKDRPTSITMNIKNSIPLPIKSTIERTSELRMQFPVSSGQQHRKGEEWQPVSPSQAKKVEEKEKPTATTVSAHTVSTAPASSSVPIVPAAPTVSTVTVAPTVSTVAVAPTVSTVAVAPAPSNIPLPLEAPPIPPELPDISLLDIPDTVMVPPRMVPPPMLPPTMVPPPGPQVFPSPVVQHAVDIGSIVSQRLTAMRKLQENPNDVQALGQMYKSNKEVQSWAVSKQQPGQFTGSTGAQILSQAQLSSGYQAWAKKDQLQTAAPLSGGMGMHLLQKMGWKPGEGLGKEKTGTLEPLLLEVKLDKRGLVANEEQKGRMRKQKGPPNMKNLQGKHPVSLLGEYATKRKLGAPQYVLEFECGPDHKKNFLFKVILNGCEYKPNVTSNNKKEAKAAAASVCLQSIGLLPS